MTCPNCGETFTTDVAICPICDTLLSNASYTPVEKKKGHKKKRAVIFIVFLIILALLCVGGYFGYEYYKNRVETECKKVTKKIFSYAEKMDFSDVDAKYLPDPLKENPDLRSLISEYIDDYIDDTALGTFLEKTNYKIDGDVICDEIISTASYEITNVTSTYHSCDVTVKTSNKNYADVLNLLTEKVTTELVKDKTFWSALTDSVSQFLFGKEADADSETINDVLLKYYKECKNEIKSTEYTGVISYGIVDGKWTITNFDTSLIFQYYGISEDMLNQ